tara:strand:- start:15 stop:713 length:699 start_codon:yes stop_codon:yes gene_type:complete
LEVDEMIKLKDVIEDLELGKVYTDKDRPPFQVESVNEAQFSKDQIEIMRKAYGTLKTMNPTSPTYKKFIKFLEKLPKNQLKQLAAANIKFVSMLAKNRIKGESVNEGPGRELPPQKYVVYTGFGSKRKIVKHGLSHKDALKLHNRIEKSGKYDDYGMDNHRDWNDKNGKQIKESVNEKVARPFSEHLRKAQDEIEYMISNGPTPDGDDSVYDKPREAMKLLQIAQKSLGKIK